MLLFIVTSQRNCLWIQFLLVVLFLDLFPHTLRANPPHDLIGERIVVGGEGIGIGFMFFDGTATLTIPSDVSGEHMNGTAANKIYRRAGEYLVTGLPHQSLSSSAVYGRCGFEGISHQQFSIGISGGKSVDHAAIIPRNIIAECLSLHPEVWSTCIMFGTPSLPKLPLCN